ncbi:MAG: PGPGW domain-containing protein [Parahaliea sp.]
MPEYLQHHWTGILIWLSLLSLVAAILILPWAVTRLPADYFVREHRSRWRDATPYPVLNIALVALKNLLGLLLALLGLIQLFTPGQGLLTLLLGLALMNFPGKFALERRIVLSKGVLQGINWLRARQGHPPLEAPTGRPAGSGSGR